MKVHKKNIFWFLFFFLLGCSFVTVIVFSVINANKIKTLKDDKSDLQKEVKNLKKRLKITEKLQET